MPNIEKRFQISCPVFWGFNRFINISEAKSVQECIDKFLQVHREFLFEQNYVDLLNFFDKLVPMNKDLYIHNEEGKDDMPAHIKSALTQSNLTISVEDKNIHAISQI